jgi:hypothetical protein
VSIPATTPDITPNVIVSNPTVRKVAGNVLGAASLLLSTAVLVDGAIPAIDYTFVTGPAAVIISGLFGIFQLAVTSPNVPTQAKTAVALEDPELLQRAWQAQVARNQAGIDAEHTGE